MSQSPTLSTCQKRAKALLKAARTGEVEALARLRAHSRTKQSASDAEIRQMVTLMQCQHVIAVEAGMRDWQHLRQWQAEAAGPAIVLGHLCGDSTDTESPGPQLLRLPASSFAQHLAITGAAGVGKTHLVANLARQLIAAGEMPTVIISPYSEKPYVEAIGSAAADRLTRVPLLDAPVGGSLRQQISTLVDDRTSRVYLITDSTDSMSEKPLRAACQRILRALITAPMTRPMLLIVDGVSIAGTKTEAALIAALADPGHLRVIIASQETSPGVLSHVGACVQMRSSAPSLVTPFLSMCATTAPGSRQPQLAEIAAARRGEAFVCANGAIHRVLVPRDAIGTVTDSRRRALDELTTIADETGQYDSSTPGRAAQAPGFQPG